MRKFKKMSSYICSKCIYLNKNSECENEDVCINHSLFKTNLGTCEEENEKEMVDHPTHYNMGKYEVIDVIEDWNLGFNLGNTVKYIARAGHKDKSKTIEDLKKSLWYLQREINRLEGGNND